MFVVVCVYGVGGGGIGRTMGVAERRHSALQKGRGGGRFLKKKHVAAILDIKYPQTPIIFSQYHFPSKDKSLLPYLPASENLPEEQIYSAEEIQWVSLKFRYKS